ncbi:MAG: serine hydrolase, partial [Bacteroidales bacterium]|nr:serine hydrolase [Bacteroidales bacterium]
MPLIIIGVVSPRGTDYYSYGVKSYETKEPVNERTVFEIGSNTKAFTGILLANEVIKGELSLDDPLQKLLPEETTAPTRNGKEIKLINLANHTSSLPRTPGNLKSSNPQNPYADLTFQQVYDFINEYELPYDIGSKWAYSNLGTGLLGTVLADKNNLDYEGLVLKEICNPLGMEETCIVLTPEMEKRLAKGHRMGDEVENWDIPTLAGCGALRSTAVDMIKFLKANMRIDKTSLYPAMELSHKHTASVDSGVKIGLGWLISDIEGEEIIWHNGGTGGYMSFMGFNKSRSTGAVVLTNSTGFPDDIGFHLLNPNTELANPKPSIATKLNRIIKNEGTESAHEAYLEIKVAHATEYSFASIDMIRLGYRFLHNQKIDEALLIFKINVELNPDDWNANDSYAEALLENNDEEEAIKYYKKSIELNPDNVA